MDGRYDDGVLRAGIQLIWKRTDHHPLSKPRDVDGGASTDWPMLSYTYAIPVLNGTAPFIARTNEEMK